MNYFFMIFFSARSLRRDSNIMYNEERIREMGSERGKKKSQRYLRVRRGESFENVRHTNTG